MRASLIISRSVGRLPALLVLLILPLERSWAAPPVPSWNVEREFRTVIENDDFYPQGASDRFYTNGTRFEKIYTYARMGDGNDAPDTALPGFLWAPWWDIARRGTDQIFEGFSLGQNMYTPSNIRRTEVQIGDRPYSAWAHVGVLWGLNEISRHRLVQHRFDFDLGVVGDHALGRELQTIIHEYGTHAPLPQGWGNQDRSDLGGRLGYSQKRIHRTARYFQAGTEGALNLGNVHTNLKLGAILKLGWVELDSEVGVQRGYWPEPILAMQRATTSPAACGGPVTPEPATRGTLYLFANPSVTLVGHNAHLQGSLRAKNIASPSEYNYADYESFANLTPQADPIGRVVAYHFFFENPNGFLREAAFARYEYLYRPLFNPNNVAPSATDFLIFNTLFNGGQSLRPAERAFLLDRLFVNPPQTETERAFVVSSLLNDGRPLDVGVRWLAYYSLVLRMRGSYDLIPDSLAFYRMFLRKRPGDVYVVEKRPYFGTLRLGLAGSLGAFSFAYVMSIRTAEFRGNRHLRQLHRFGELHVSYRW